MTDLNRLVYVQGEGSAQWDGIIYTLSEPVQVRLGVARHWEVLGHRITITDAPEANIPPRDVVNPLADNKGTAFEGLKRRGRPKGE